MAEWPSAGFVPAPAKTQLRQERGPPAKCNASLFPLPSSLFPLSSFNTPGHYALDVVPLEKEKDGEHRYDSEHGARHHQLGVQRVLARKIRQSHRQRVMRYIA